MRRTAIIFWFCVRAIYADGGSIQLRRQSGSFLITVFTTPTPLTSGPADLSVLLQDPATLRPILNADVRIAIEGAVIHASREQAQNKLLYAALVSLHPGGRQFTVRISRGGEFAVISGELHVAPASFPVADYWGYLAVPPLSILIFLVHQRLRRTSKP